jgi:F-type H+-transporting ATPase subunit delta
MQNPRLAYRYAKSLIDISVEQGQLENVFADMQYLQAVCKSSKEFVTLLRSPIIKGDKKLAVLNAVSKGKVGIITDSFNKLLVNKGREESLPEIIAAFIEQYQALKGIHTVKLTTAQPLSEEVKSAIIAKLQSSTGMKNVDLETAVKDELIGGFVLEYNNNLVDASILRDLQDIQRQFMSNDYVMKLK